MPDYNSNEFHGNASSGEGILISEVEPSSIGEEMGVKKGDRLLDINGYRPRDIIDYYWLTNEENLELTLWKNCNGEYWTLDLEKDFQEPMGLHFDPPAMRAVRRCRNNCVFCFVDQNPPHLRDTIYFKDDDYLLSFLEGHYITLNSLTTDEVKRIIREKISPLYISIHTTDPGLRRRMMQNPAAAKIKERLKHLTDGGVHLHGQIVMCPGWNDGKQLERTLEDLFQLAPYLNSVAVVPVGLTRYRQGLVPLEPVTEKEACCTLVIIHRFQEKALPEMGTRFVFGADELYLKAGMNLPPEEAYEEYPQLSNGVGVIRLFWEEYREWDQKWPQWELSRPIKITLVTGKASRQLWEEVTERMNQKVNRLEVQLEVVPNLFFGPQVSVSGLLTGTDLEQHLKRIELGDAVIFPRVMLKELTETFLDNRTPGELSLSLGIPFFPAGSMEELTGIIEKLARDGRESAVNE